MAQLAGWLSATENRAVFEAAQEIKGATHLQFYRS